MNPQPDQTPTFEDVVSSILRHNVAPFTYDYDEVTDEMMVKAILEAHQAALQKAEQAARIDALTPYAAQFEAGLKIDGGGSGFEFYWGTRLLSEYRRLTDTNNKDK